MYKPEKDSEKSNKPIAKPVIARDPTEVAKRFPVEIWQEIFGKLEAKDLFELSLVNKKWNKIIFTSTHCMEKIKLKFESSSMTPEEKKNLLLESSRQYENISVSGKIDKLWEEFFHKGEHHWKYVRFCHCIFDSGESLMCIMESLEPTVEELRIVRVKMPTPNRLNETLTFPKLKKLEVARFELALKMLAGCSTLTTFKYWGKEPGFFCEEHGDASETVEVIQQILHNNAELKDVCLEGFEIEGVFDEHLGDNIIFRLQELQLHKGLYLNIVASPFIALFLETQFESLESLKVTVGLPMNAFDVIMRMPKLTLLEIEPFNNLEWQFVQFPENNVIESLTIVGRALHTEEAMKTFLDALPNLKHLTVSEMGEDIFECLIQKCPNLESLQCSFGFGVSLERIVEGNVLPNLQKLEVGGYTAITMIRSCGELSTVQQTTIFV